MMKEVGKTSEEQSLLKKTGGRPSRVRPHFEARNTASHKRNSESQRTPVREHQATTKLVQHPLPVFRVGGREQFIKDCHAKRCNQWDGYQEATTLSKVF